MIQFFIYDYEDSRGIDFSYDLMSEDPDNVGGITDQFKAMQMGWGFEIED